MMEKEVFEKYKKAGKVIAEVMRLAKKHVKPGLKISELAEFVEKRLSSWERNQLSPRASL